MNSPARQTLKANAQKILSPTFNGTETFVIHKDGLEHLIEDLQKSESDNESMKYELKRLRHKVEELQEELAKEKRVQQKQELPFDPAKCEYCKTIRGRYTNPTWLDYECWHPENELTNGRYHPECDAEDYRNLGDLVDVSCPRIKEWLKEGE